MNKKSLSQIIYISIPEEAIQKIGNMPLDPTILLPVEIPEGIKPSEWNPSELRWEMIISGMLKILAYERDNSNIDYYRSFILSSRPEIAAELTQSAIIKSQTGDFELAEEIFQALIGLDPDDLRSSLNLILLYENRMNSLRSRTSSEYEKLNSAIESMYSELLLRGEDLPDIYFNAAWFYHGRQDFKRAHELGRSFLSMAEDEVKRSEAEKLVRECAELKDKDTAYREAYSLINRDRDEEGLELITQFLEGNEKVWNAWFLKGWALRKLSRFEEALPAFMKAGELKGSQADILNELAICTLELGDYAASSKYLHEALSQEPENLKIISNMGILALKQGKKEEAAAFFRTVLELDPEDEIACEYLNFLEK